MGFLSGVLSNIKEHLGQHKGQITSAIEALKQNKHLGKNGFNVAIGSVVEGVRGYNKEVKKSNEQVKKIVTDFQDYTKNNGKLLNDIYNIQVTDESKDKGFNKAKTQVEERLQECQREARNFANALDVNSNKNENKDAINDLNDKVKQKLANVRSTVMYENERLQVVKAHAEGELAATIKQVGEALSALKVSVDCNIRDEVTLLVNDLKTRVEKIFEELKAVDQKLRGYVKNLADWINAANEAVDVAVNKVDEILKQVDLNDGAEYPRQMQTEIEQILVQASVLFGTAGAAGDKVTELVTAAKEKVKKLEEGLMQDLHGMRELIKSKVSAVQNKIGKLYKVFDDGDVDAVLNAGDKKIEGVMEAVKIMVGIINGSNGLKGIERQVQTYANKFTKLRFEGDVVQKWIEGIMNDDKTVKGKILQYNLTNKSHFTTLFKNGASAAVNKPLNELIVEEIITKLKEKNNVLDKATATFNTAHDTAESVHQNMTAVENVCKQFAIELGRKIEGEGQINAVASSIAEKVSGEVKNPSHISQLDHGELTSAIEYILVALQAKSSQVAKELNTFFLHDTGNTAYTMARNLDGAMIAAVDLFQNINTATASNMNGDAIIGATNYAGEVDEAVQGVSDEITRQLPDDPQPDNSRGDPRISLEKFNYSFGQPTSGGRGGSKSRKDNLDEAIEKIQNDVSDTLQGANQPFADLQSHVSAVTTKLSLLCEGIKRAAKAENPDGVKKKLVELRDLINKDGDIQMKNKNQKSLNKIHIDLNKLQRDLESGLIKTASTFLGHATAAGRLTIEALKKHAGEQVKIAQDTLITHARKQYVLSLKLALQRFAEKTTTELQPLPNAISDDLEHGHKKFMNIFADTFLAKTKEIDAIDITSAKKERYPLSKAADVCKDAVKGFLTKLQKHNDFTSDVDKVSPSTNALRTLFSRLRHTKHFNKEFSDNLQSLANELRRLNPKAYGEGNNPWLFESLKKGLSLLVEEFGKTYISTYSQQTIEWEQATADEKLRYAKVLFTMTPFIYHELTELKDRLEKKDDKWNLYGIYNSSDPQSSLDVRYFRENGYDVGLPDNAAHGELNHRETLKGSTIHRHLTADKHQLFKQTATALSSSGDDGGLTVELEEENGVIRRLYDCLHTYSRVCHLIIHPKIRPPCSVYEILVWCCGLQFNPVYEKLKAQVKSEFMKEDKLNPGTKKLQPFDAHPSPFEHTHIDEALYYVSAHSHAVLTAILGHGHKDGIYACEFSTNSLKFDYPSNMIQLLCTLFDLLKRLYHQLYFLLQQCQLTTQLSGWKDCHYGRYIGGSGWQCNTKQCPKQDCDQRHDQSGNQTGEQFPNCGVKSPLQSFLEDGLKGHLPHSVAARGSSLSCGTCGSTPGLPCRTPMGFADIGAIASHTMIGQNICDVLHDFCGRPNSPLTRLCGYLNCLLPSAPKTLADMFSFYYHLTDRWGMYGQTHKQLAFVEKVNAANFGRDYGKLNVYHLFTPSHSALKKGHSDGSLGSLVCLSRDAVVCGPYLRPISHAIYDTFSSKHADKYLSWIVYLTSTFYDLLKKLYDECNSKCGSRGSNCHVKACVKECPTTSKQDPPRYHHRNCQSIVSCNSTMPTFAKYGFVLGNPERLNGSQGIEKKRTCRDFCNVFAEAFEKDSHLVQFCKAIDKFIFTIRQPFIWLNVALWSLSLFYLLCVMVGRLDVLHIRSHLRIPSSHQITAQSLLAAAQVGRLAKISYLQP